MDNEKNTGAVSGGVGFGGLLFLVFLVLKLCNVISWSWWWVTAPLWGPLALGLVIFIIWMAVYLISDAIKTAKLKKRNKNT